MPNIILAVVDGQQEAEELIQGIAEAYPDMLIRVSPPLEPEAIVQFVQAFDELTPITNE